MYRITTLYQTRDMEADRKRVSNGSIRTDGCKIVNLHIMTNSLLQVVGAVVNMYIFLCAKVCIYIDLLSYLSPHTSETNYRSEVRLMNSSN